VLFISLSGQMTLMCGESPIIRLKVHNLNHDDIMKQQLENNIPLAGKKNERTEE
jgi:hypothetical protein